MTKMAIVAFALTLAAGVSGARAADAVKVTYASFDALYAPYFIAIDKGYFADSGLDVSLLQAGGGTSTPALMAGSVQFSSSSGSAVSAIIRGAKLKVVMTLAVSLPWKLWATSPDIKTIQDLKGKPVGVETLGGLDELAMRAALMKADLPQDFVAYSPVGVGGVQRIAIMKHASMPAIFLSYVEERMARADGALANGHVLIDFPKQIQIPYNGLATSQALIDSDPGMVGRFVKGVVMGIRYMQAHRDGTLRILKKNGPNVADEQMSESFDETSPTVLARGEAALPLRQFDLRLRSVILGLAEKDAPPLEKVYDYSFVQKAVAALDASHWQPTE